MIPAAVEGRRALPRLSHCRCSPLCRCCRSLLWYTTARCCRAQPQRRTLFSVEGLKQAISDIWQGAGKQRVKCAGGLGQQAWGGRLPPANLYPVACAMWVWVSAGRAGNMDASCHLLCFLSQP